jgi:ABC-type Na+ transport system ATPase subunit NatA
MDVSCRMTIALQVRGLRKRYTAGMASCGASAEVLRGVDLTVFAGEALLVAGDPGAGKSTLMLCLAGLLSVDAGDIEWFASRDRSAAARHVVYHIARGDLLRAGASSEPHIHLVDLGAGTLERTLDDWIAARRNAGDAVIVTTRRIIDAPYAVDRVVSLRNGTLRASLRPTARVAERAGR